MYPRRNEKYSYEAISQMDLPDSPHLCFWHDGMWVPIQDSCATTADTLGIPGFAQTEWRYGHTTDELIPIFYYASETPITEFVTIEPMLHPLDDQDKWWATFIRYPQPQFGSEATQSQAGTIHVYLGGE
jgi:hypothetical protein